MNPGKAALLLSVSVAVVSFVAAPFARAQGALYGTVTAQKLGGLSYSTVGTGTTTALTTRTDGSFSPIGGTGGLFYDFKSIGRVRLGADVRGSIAHSSHGADPSNTGAGARLYTVMGGVRASFPAHYKLLAPYVQGSAGLARTDSGKTLPSTTNSANSFTDGRVVINHGFVYQAFLGLDLKVLPVMDIRIAEFGIGGVSGITNESGSHLLQSVGVGVVLHLPQ